MRDTRVSAFVGFGVRDGDVTGVDLVRVVVAGDREGSVRGQQDVVRLLRCGARLERVIRPNGRVTDRRVV